jgi:hypothetical protein
VPVLGFSTTDYLSQGAAALFCVSVAESADNTITVQIRSDQITIEYNNHDAGDGQNGIDARGNPQVLLLSCYKKTCHNTIVASSVKVPAKVSSAKCDCHQ